MKKNSVKYLSGDELYYYGKEKYHEKNYDEAVRVFELTKKKKLEQYSEQDLFYYLSQSYKCIDDYTRSIENAIKAVEADKTKLYPWNHLCMLYIKILEFEGAKMVIELIEERFQNNPLAQEAKAYMLYNKDELKQSLALYKLILSEDPTHLEANYKKTMIHLKSKQFIRAVDSFKNLCKYDTEKYYVNKITSMFNKEMFNLNFQ
jgi:tetratricopeptide (TPR) repeat protein